MISFGWLAWVDGCVVTVRRKIIGGYDGKRTEGRAGRRDKGRWKKKREGETE